jgi:hypothetical protein
MDQGNRRRRRQLDAIQGRREARIEGYKPVGPVWVQLPHVLYEYDAIACIRRWLAKHRDVGSS